MAGYTEDEVRDLFEADMAARTVLEIAHDEENERIAADDEPLDLGEEDHPEVAEGFCAFEDGRDDGRYDDGQYDDDPSPYSGDYSEM